MTLNGVVAVILHYYRLRAAQACRYLIYSEADFEVFRPAGATRCTDGGEIWHGGGDFLRGEKPQNRPLSKLNTGRLALRASGNNAK